MTRGPQSPRGRKAKGDLAEARVKRALQNGGYTVIDCRMTEPGLDLMFWTTPKALPHGVEVKARGKLYDLGPDDKTSIWKRAQWCEARGWAYTLAFIENATPLRAIFYSVEGLEPNAKRGGLSLKVYEWGKLVLPAVATPLPWDLPGTPSASASGLTSRDLVGAPDPSEIERVDLAEFGRGLPR